VYKRQIRKPYILYLGTIEPRKNLNRLIQAYEKACRELPEPPMLVLAGGTGWKAEDTRRLAAETLPGQIVLTGYISGAEKRLLYQHASLFAFPSLYEGFGIPVLEAMRYGIPVVCADTSSLPEVAGDSARLVDPLDVNDIASGMLEMLTNPDRAAALSAAGKIGTERFSWDKSAEKLMQIYRKLGE
jgi:glycosyltransferase involved in cell wall biosynthesis